MSDKVDTYSVECNCGTCQALRDSVAPSCGGCRYRHNEVVTLTAENKLLRAKDPSFSRLFVRAKANEHYWVARQKHLDEENEALRKKVEEAKNQFCHVCIARRGIDKCRPDEAFHVTHYNAEEMHLDPLPDKPCECGGE